MLHEEPKKKREQFSVVCIEDLVPQNHLLRKIERVIDWSFIYDLVKEKYSPDFGRPSVDPVILIKIVLIQYLYGIRSMRQTIREIEVNLAYRWFLGLDMYDKVPHFSTFGKNYTRRFKGTDLFEQIFSKILQECINAVFVYLFLKLLFIEQCFFLYCFLLQFIAVGTRFYVGRIDKHFTWINQSCVNAFLKNL